MAKMEEEEGRKGKGNEWICEGKGKRMAMEGRCGKGKS